MKNSISYYQIHDKIYKKDKDYYYQYKNRHVLIASGSTTPLTSEEVLHHVKSEGYKEYYIKGFRVLTKDIFYI